MPDNAPTGATPAVTGATPAQTTPVSPAAEPAASTTPATGQDALGDAGKRALDAMKSERDVAVREAKVEKAAREALENASATDTEKALKAARAEGLAEGHAQIRRAEVKAALVGAGINASILDLALGAAEFASLKVNAEGEVEGLSQAIEAFKKARADQFKLPTMPSTADGGIRGTAPNAPLGMNELIRAARG